MLKYCKVSKIWNKAIFFYIGKIISGIM